MTYHIFFQSELPLLAMIYSSLLKCCRRVGVINLTENFIFLANIQKSSAHLLGYTAFKKKFLGKQVQ